MVSDSQDAAAPIAAAKRFLDASPADWQPQVRRHRPLARRFSSRSVSESVLLTLEFRRGQMLPRDVVPILDREGVGYVLLGFYGISGWLKEPRATQDVDVLVAGRDVRRTVRAVVNAFPTLTPKDTPVVVRLFDGDTAVLDVMKAHHALFEEALRTAVVVKLFGLQVRVPALEMALALKFFSMTSLGRRMEDKYQDAHDFINIVKHNTTLSEERLRRWGEMAYDGGGADLIKMVADARAGRRLEI